MCFNQTKVNQILILNSFQFVPIRLNTRHSKMKNVTASMIDCSHNLYWLRFQWEGELPFRDPSKLLDAMEYFSTCLGCLFDWYNHYRLKVGRPYLNLKKIYWKIRWIFCESIIHFGHILPYSDAKCIGVCWSSSCPLASTPASMSLIASASFSGLMKQFNNPLEIYAENSHCLTYY